MDNKLYSFLLLTTLFIFNSTKAIDQATVINETLAHIAQEKQVIKNLATKSITISKAARKSAKISLKNDYAQLKTKIKSLLTTIAQSKEFAISINQVTDFQTECIVEKNMHFDEITYDPSSYPITEKINAELITHFPDLDQKTENLFNIFYVAFANLRGCSMLLEKLSLKELQLVTQLQTHQAII